MTYISREAAIEAMYKDAEAHPEHTFWVTQYEALRNIPAADVRPVVLCKDCIHCKKGKASLECEKHTYAWNNMRRWVDEDDFCKWGVKRGEG